MTDHITFFQSYYEAAAGLPADQFKEIMDAVFRYVFYDEEPQNLSPFANGYFILMKPNLDASRKKSDAGSKGGMKQSGSKTEANAKQSGSKTEANAKQAPSDKEKEKDKEGGVEEGSGKGKGKGDGKTKKRPAGASVYADYFPDDPELQKAFNEFAEMRKTLRAPLTEGAVDETIRNLHKICGNDRDMMIRVLRQSVQRSWRGVFPLKEPEETNRPRDGDNRRPVGAHLLDMLAEEERKEGSG